MLCRWAERKFIRDESLSPRQRKKQLQEPLLYLNMNTYTGWHRNHFSMMQFKMAYRRVRELQKFFKRNYPGLHAHSGLQDSLNHFLALRAVTATLEILPLLSPGVVPLSGQTATGELRLAVKDESGAGMAASVTLVNEATRTSQAVELPSDGRYSFRNLPFGFYRLLAARAGFSASAELIEIRSALPRNHAITLTVQAAKATVAVTESDTMVDPARIGVAY